MPSNIAEGKARQTAHGSGAELESHLELGSRVKPVNEREAEILMADAQEIGRMLQGLVASLERSVAER